MPSRTPFPHKIFSSEVGRDEGTCGILIMKLVVVLKRLLLFRDVVSSRRNFHFGNCVKVGEGHRSLGIPPQEKENFATC